MYISEFHRILEWFGFEGTSKEHLVQPCWNEQEYLQLDHVAQNPIQPVLEQFQGWELLWLFKVRNPEIMSELELLFVVSTRFKAILYVSGCIYLINIKVVYWKYMNFRICRTTKLSADKVFCIFWQEFLHPSTFSCGNPVQENLESKTKLFCLTVWKFGHDKLKGGAAGVLWWYRKSYHTAKHFWVWFVSLALKEKDSCITTP